MQREDIPRFTQWLTELAEYFPYTKLNLEVLVPGYFQALQALDMLRLGPLMSLVLQQCRFFPSVAELLSLVQTLQPISRCRQCPGGHGVHEGHRVAHYPAGPWCQTCETDMSQPAGYVDRPPPRRFPPLLPQRTEELSSWEVRQMVENILADMNKRAEGYLSHHAGNNGRYQPHLTGEAVEERRSYLRAQAREMLEDAAF